MLSDYQKEQLSAEIIPMFQDLEQDTIQDIARRLRKSKRWTESAELQAKALESLGYSPSQIQARVLDKLHADKDFIDMLNENTLEHKKLVRERIRETVDSAQAHGDKIIGRAGDMSFADDVAFWKTKGQHLKSSPALKQISAESSKRLEHELKSLTHSTGFKFLGAPVSVDQAFNHSMDKAVMNVASGAFSSEQAVEQVVSDLEKSGLRYVNYASGITRGIDVAAHLAVRTTLNQMAADISMSNAEQLGTDLVEVSSHGGARDGDGHANHAGWQGKVYSISGKAHPKESKRLGYKILSLEAVTGYPHDPAGLCGYNCKHTFYPFIEGISDPTPIEKEPEPVKVDGRTYTFYQATQYQRRLERELREFKRQYLGGQNMTAAITAKEQQYARFCEKAGLKQNLNRLYVKGYKRDFEYIKLSNSLKKMSENDKINIDFYGGPDHKKLVPAKLKAWLGENKYQELMQHAEGEEAKKYIRTAYRKKSIIGDGGTVAVRKFEKATGLNLGRNGKDHSKKVNDLVRQLTKSLENEMSDSDKRFLMSELKKLKEVQDNEL